MLSRCEEKSLSFRKESRPGRDGGDQKKSACRRQEAASSFQAPLVGFVAGRRKKR